MNDAKATIAKRLRFQAGWCDRLGSPLYAAMLEEAAADTERGGAAWRVLAGHEHDPPGSALALRLLGSIHRLVLEDRLPALAALFPSAGGVADPERASTVLLEVLADRREELRALLDQPVQTNEVWRSTALLGGFLVVAAETGLPLRLLEVGASAGLNLRFDRYWYSSQTASFGDPASSVRFADVFVDGRAPPMDVEVEIAGRRGCDASPLDPASHEDRLTLMSFVWPDQRERLDLLRSALALAPATPVEIDRADAADWVEEMLAEQVPGTATVLFHSVVAMYLEQESAERLHAAIQLAGRRATAEAPFAWLFMEPGEEMAEVRLRLWPGGGERLLAKCGFQRGPVSWLGL
jgi:hypothetical protein